MEQERKYIEAPAQEPGSIELIDTDQHIPEQADTHDSSLRCSTDTQPTDYQNPRVGLDSLDDEDHRDSFISNLLKSERFKFSCVWFAIFLIGGLGLFGIKVAAKQQDQKDCWFPMIAIWNTSSVLIGKPDMAYAMLPTRARWESPLGKTANQIRAKYLTSPALIKENVLTRHAMAGHLLDDYDVQGASILIDQLLVDLPETPEMLYLKATALCQSLEFEAAHACVKKASAICRQSGGRIFDGKFADQEACILAAKGRWSDIDLKRTLGYIHPWQALALIHLGENEEAYSRISAPMFASPKSYSQNYWGNPWIYLYRAHLLMDKGLFIDARDMADELSRVNKPLSDELSPLAASYMIRSELTLRFSKSGDEAQAEALEYLNQASLISDDPSIDVARIQLLNKTGRYDDALRLAKTVNQARLLYFAPRYFCEKGIAELGSGDFAAALSSLEQSIKINPHIRESYVRANPGLSRITKPEQRE